MVILLKGTYYHYCEIGRGTLDALLGAESMGRYFNANIKGSGSDGPFDCRRLGYRRTNGLIQELALFGFLVQVVSVMLVVK